MSKKDFEDLLEKHENKSEQKDIDWKTQKDEWLGFINQFYSSVKSWFKPYEESGKLSYEFKKVEITEDYIGTYEVDVMNVNFAGQKLSMQPIGTLLIGTKGRIDMEGSKGRVQFILADKDSQGMKISVSISVDGEPQKKQKDHKKPEWTWKIVLKESRKISYMDFNEENFFDALMEIVNG